MEMRNRNTSRVVLASMGIISLPRVITTQSYRLRPWDIPWQILLIWLTATILFCTVSQISKTWIENKSETYEQYRLAVSRIYQTVFRISYFAALWASHMKMYEHAQFYL